jgi:hypothetical protein
MLWKRPAAQQTPCKHVESRLIEMWQHQQRASQVCQGRVQAARRRDGLPIIALCSGHSALMHRAAAKAPPVTGGAFLARP